MIVIISNPTPVKDELKIIHQLFNDGLEVFHVRKKEFSEVEIRKFIEAISNKYHDKIVLHSHYNLAEEYNLKGIHVPVSYNYNVYNRTVSISFHSLKEIQKFDKKFEYAFLSPIFDSISKQNYKSNFDLQCLKNYRELLKDKNIIALGGVDEDNIDTLKNTGFPGIALLGAIWQNENPNEKFKKIKVKWLKKEFVC